MCYQKRLLYGACNHSAPLGLVATCPDRTSCDGTARVHPLQTIRVEMMCPACKAKRVKVDNNLTTIAERIRRLREELVKRGMAGKKDKKGGEKEDETPKSGGEGLDVDSPEKTKAGLISRGGNEAEDDNERNGDVTSQYEDRHDPSVTAEADGSPSSDPVASAIKVPLTKRNDMFVGGLCLASTSLTTVRGEKIF